MDARAAEQRAVLVVLARLPEMRAVLEQVQLLLTHYPCAVIMVGVHILCKQDTQSAQAMSTQALRQLEVDMQVEVLQCLCTHRCHASAAALRRQPHSEGLCSGVPHRAPAGGHQPRAEGWAESGDCAHQHVPVQFKDIRRRDEPRIFVIDIFLYDLHPSLNQIRQ